MKNKIIIIVLLIIIFIILYKKFSFKENMEQSNYSNEIKINTQILYNSNKELLNINNSDEDNCLNVEFKEASNICNNNNKCNGFFKNDDSNKYCFYNSYDKLITLNLDKISIYNKKNYDSNLGIVCYKCNINYDDMVKYLNLIKKNINDNFKDEKINFEQIYKIAKNILENEFSDFDNNYTNDLIDCIIKYIYTYNKNKLNIIDDFKDILNEIDINQLSEYFSKKNRINIFKLYYDLVNKNNLSDEEKDKIIKDMNKDELANLSIKASKFIDKPHSPGTGQGYWQWHTETES